MTIDWTDPQSKVTPHFTVGEWCYLPGWRVYHVPSDDEAAEIVKTSEVMEEIRSLLGDRAVTITSGIRPPIARIPGSKYSGRDYNASVVGAAPRSWHRLGMACDFTVKGLTCDQVRKELYPYLEELDIRIEDMPGYSWVHIDRGPTTSSGGNRRFKV